MGGVSSIAVSADGKLIVSGSNDATVRIWNAQTGSPIAEHMKRDVHCVAISNDGTRLISGSSDHTIRI